MADELAKSNRWVPPASPNTVERILRDVGLWPEPAPASKGGDPEYSDRPHQGLGTPGLSPDESARRLWLL